MRRIAELVGQSQSQVSEILAGRQVIFYDVLVRIADGLGIPRGWMGLAYDAITRAQVMSAEQAPEEDENVKPDGDHEGVYLRYGQAAVDLALGRLDAAQHHVSTALHQVGH